MSVASALTLYFWPRSVFMWRMSKLLTNRDEKENKTVPPEGSTSKTRMIMAVDFIARWLPMSLSAEPIKVRSAPVAWWQHIPHTHTTSHLTVLLTKYQPYATPMQDISMLPDHTYVYEWNVLYASILPNAYIIHIINDKWVEAKMSVLHAALHRWQTRFGFIKTLQQNIIHT